MGRLRFVLFCLTLLVCARPAMAGLVYQAVPMRFLDAGGYCMRRPLGQEAAPDTRAGVTDVVGRYDFFTGGDVPASVDVGVGVVAWIDNLWDTVPLMIETRVPGYGPPDRYTALTGRDGSFWIGFKPAFGEALLTGIYRFDVYRDGVHILRYDIRVVPPEGEEPCRASVS